MVPSSYTVEPGVGDTPGLTRSRSTGHAAMFDTVFYLL